MLTTKIPSASAGAFELPPLSAEKRRAVCVHEAGHAVVHALGGAFVYGLRVAPLGATDWRTRGRKGAKLADLWGVCLVSDAPCGIAMEWHEFDGLSVNRPLWLGMLAMYESAAKGARVEARRQLRAWIAGTMGGPMAEAMCAGEPCDLAPDDWAELSDETMIEALAWLLPQRAELEHLQALTAHALALLEVWACVLRVADALEARGSLSAGQVSKLLPAPVPSWPPSLRTRQAVPVVVKLPPGRGAKRQAATAAKGQHA
jgi:hypothetical protein